MSNYSQNKKKGFEINILGYFKELSKRIIAIAMIAVLCAAVGGIVGRIVKKDIYSSKISFVVNTLTSDEMAGSSAISAQINMANTFKYILSGRNMKEAIVEVCGPEYSYSLVNKSITVTTVSSTNVVELKVETDDPEKTYTIAQAVASAYGDIVADIYPNAKLTICDRPVKPASADSDRSPLVIAAVCCVLGIMIYCIVIFVLFVIKDTVKTADELTSKLEVPVLGSVQNVTNKSKMAKGLLIADRKTGFSFIETYKAIRTKIESNSQKTGNKVYIVTSACENEGKTTVSVNIALSLAENGKSVLLIDADLRNPSICKLLALPETGAGFADVINGTAQLGNAIKYVKDFNVYVLADQKAVENPSEILSTRVTEEIIKSVRNEFDFVIIDTAPASVVTDASVIAGFADGAVIVVREDTSPFARIQLSVDDIDANGAEIVGCVFNGDTSATHRGGRYGKYGHYGKYGQYGKYGYGYGYSYGAKGKR